MLFYYFYFITLIMYGSNSNIEINLDTEDYDTDNTFASNKFTVPSGKAGKYCFHYNMY